MTQTRSHFYSETSALFGLSILVLFSFANNLYAQRTKNDSRKRAYVDAVTRGEGFLPWQKKGVSKSEKQFRSGIEQRKDEMLAARAETLHPVMLTEKEIRQAQQNIKSSGAAQNWFARQKRIADYIAQQPDNYVETMIEELTPTHAYGFTCPNCVGKKSQECAGDALVGWDYRHPDRIRCKRCGRTYPDPKYAETAKLVCPRTGQEFTYYLNEEEQKHPEDRSGKYAWHWVGYPMHISFTGIIRAEKDGFMLAGLRSLAIVYGLTGDPRYAERAVQILVRFAHCYRNWLYHDYWDTIADCDPMYAAWHDGALPLEWKRHLCTSAFAKDTVDHAAMLQTYWGAGRYHPSTDNVGVLAGICLAYDLVYDAKDSQGCSLWTPEKRAKVERDLILEWGIGAEPFVGGRNQAKCVNNKSPRIYNAQAAIGKCLGLPELVDTALRGYEAVRDHSFNYDGFSTESPAYTNMYLGQLLEIPETLNGFRWPDNFPKRKGVVDLYQTDPRLRLMYKSVADQLRPDGRYLPLSDTNVVSSPSSKIIDLGLERYPKYYKKRLPPNLTKRAPDEYRLFHFDLRKPYLRSTYNLPEILYPAWMTGILRHGTGPKATVLALAFNPPGGHRHNDNLALFYSDSGTTILGDLGYLCDMPNNHWIHSTFSHNLIVVDDQEQRQKERRPKCLMMATSPKVSVVEASSNAYSQCQEYRRLVALVKGPGAQTFAIDIFRVTGGDKHSYRIFSELASSDAKKGQLLFSGISMPVKKPLPHVGASLKKEDIFGLRDIRIAKNPPHSWQATWSEPARRYRLWMLSKADRVEASNGPGQRTLQEAGRRTRYVDVIREGNNLASAFVAVHEPSFPDRSMPIRLAERLTVPKSAGPDAVALRIESAWGTYIALNHFSHEATVAGIRFQGRFGLWCKPRRGNAWLLSLGAQTLQRDHFGFLNKTAVWRGEVKENTEARITTASPKPGDWPQLRKEFQSYALVDDGTYVTGFPIENVGANRIQVTRFPLPPVKQFEAHALRYMEQQG